MAHHLLWTENADGSPQLKVEIVLHWFYTFRMSLSAALLILPGNILLFLSDAKHADGIKMQVVNTWHKTPLEPTNQCHLNESSIQYTIYSMHLCREAVERNVY